MARDGEQHAKRTETSQECSWTFNEVRSFGRRDGEFAMNNNRPWPYDVTLDGTPFASCADLRTAILLADQAPKGLYAIRWVAPCGGIVRAARYNYQSQNSEGFGLRLEGLS